MAQLTFDEYKKAILKQMRLARTDDYTGILSDPSPASLRDFCIMFYDRGLNASDEKIFRMFFGVTEHENLRKAIEQFNTGKFKSVIAFIGAEKNSQKKAGIELAAVLCDFRYRPYSNFVKSDYVPEKEEEKEGSDIDKGNENPPLPSDKKKWRWYIFAGVVIGILAASYLLSQKNTQCLKWRVDHYELVNCHGEDSITGYRKELLHFRKLKVSDTTTFFKDGRPVVWYSKSDNLVEYYNADEPHPETAKRLKPITWHIIRNYVLK